MDRSRFATWTRRRFGTAAGALLPVTLGLVRQQGAAAGHKHHHHHKQKHAPITRNLAEVGSSGVGGTVTLRQLKKKGTAISVAATGLDEGTNYVSLYYDNDVCALEEYDEDDFIGDQYEGDADGNGETSGRAGDDLKQIGSVSVRLAGEFTLLACATV